jgi:hypothetical protein
MLKTFIAAASTAIVTFLVAIISIPTDFVVGRLKFAMNRADQRDERYKTVSDEVSRYVFAAQTFNEFFARDLDRATVEATIKEYNEAIVDLRTHEYAHRATISKYWPEATAKSFDALMHDIRVADAIAHEVNDPLIIYLNDPTKPAPLLRDAAVKSVAARLNPEVARLCGSAETFLFSLAGVPRPPERKSCA